jgi:hypothetical protein
MPPTKKARMRRKKIIRASKKRQSKKQRENAVKRKKSLKKSNYRNKSHLVRIPSDFNVNRRPKTKSSPKPKRKRSNNLRHLLNRYNYMNLGVRQPSSNLIRFDTQERAYAQKPLIERRDFKKLLNRQNYMDVGARQPSSNLIRFDTQERAYAQKPLIERDFKKLLNRQNYMDVGARQPSSNLIRFDPEERANAQKPLMARRTQNLRNFLSNYEKTYPGKLYNILPSQSRDHFNEYDKKLEQRLKLRKLGEEMLKQGKPVNSLTQYSPMIREIYKIDPHDLDAEFALSTYNQSKRRGIKKSEINKIRKI